MKTSQSGSAVFHLPGLFEFHELYKVFFPIFFSHREYFYDWVEIGSAYGAPADCIWGGGRVGTSRNDPKAVLEFMREYGVSSVLTFSNSLIKKVHLEDKFCNSVCNIFETDDLPQNGVIVNSELLLEHIKTNYPGLFLVSSTTKVLTNFSDFKFELKRRDFLRVVIDFRLNKQFRLLNSLSDADKEKVEFLCNECCFFACPERKACYENVSRKNLGENCADHYCVSPYAKEGYSFSKAMENPGFIGTHDIQNVYLPAGFSNFKIEGRSLGSALILEFLLYYLAKPEYHIKLREMIYLTNTLDLF